MEDHVELLGMGDAKDVYGARLVRGVVLKKPDGSETSGETQANETPPRRHCRTLGELHSVRMDWISLGASLYQFP